jgi:hypothetical protein
VDNNKNNKELQEIQHFFDKIHVDQQQQQTALSFDVPSMGPARQHNNDNATVARGSCQSQAMFLGKIENLISGFSCRKQTNTLTPQQSSNENAMCCVVVLCRHCV